MRKGSTLEATSYQGETTPVNIRVRLIGEIRQLAGVGEITIETQPPVTVAKILKSMCAMLSKEFSCEVFNDLDEINPTLAVLVNGVSINKESEMNLLPEDAEVKIALLQILEGG